MPLFALNDPPQAINEADKSENLNDHKKSIVVENQNTPFHLIVLILLFAERKDEKNCLSQEGLSGKKKFVVH